MQLTNLEKALLCAARAFAACYQGTEIANPGEGMPPKPKAQQNRPTATSNDIPVCSLHGKAMRPSKYKENEYYCGSKLADGSYCKQKGYVLDVDLSN